MTIEETSTSPASPLEQVEKEPITTETETTSTETPSETIISEGEESEANGGGGGAYNPETGEINWDCPCLGGMAHGPCGQEFRAAFSCFVYSEDEPKGINCVELFKAMQDCFREHPEVYGEGASFSTFVPRLNLFNAIFSTEIMNDDDDDVQNLASPEQDDKTNPVIPTSESAAS